MTRWREAEGDLSRQRSILDSAFNGRQLVIRRGSTMDLDSSRITLGGQGQAVQFGGEGGGAG